MTQSVINIFIDMRSIADQHAYKRVADFLDCSNYHSFESATLVPLYIGTAIRNMALPSLHLFSPKTFNVKKSKSESYFMEDQKNFDNVAESYVLSRIFSIS